jgi:CheY-like chemotaxis protein
MQMPEMDGIEATVAIRALDIPEAKTVPIIALTANVFRDDIERCLEAGMNDHLGKPIEFPVMLQKMKSYLNTR